MLRNSSLPIVIINGRDHEGTYPSVSDNVDHGMKLVADELVKHGHREVAILVADEPITFDAAVRINLLKSHLAPHGITISDHRIIRAEADADALLTRLCQEPNPPTAIFCWHDRLAYRVLAAAERIGLQIPSQMSIIGYDGIHWPSETSHIAASVRVDLNSLARRAVEILDRYLTNPPEMLVEETEPVFFVNGTTLGQRRASSAIHLQRSTDK
jgi:DNA-binding LacI/PurR family transcriptional regulator